MIAVEILRNEHGVILEALDLLEQHSRRIVGGAVINREFAQWMLQFMREFAEDTHHAKEEGVLFGVLERLAAERMVTATARMRADHDASRRLTRELEQQLTANDAGSFAATALRMVDGLRRHLLKESDLLFPLADEVMSPDDDAASLEAYGNVVHRREGVLVRQRHLAAIERWRQALGACDACP